MGDTNKNSYKSKQAINKVESTDELITGRGGLNLFVKYLENTLIIANMLIPYFGKLRKSRKGIPVQEIFKQLFFFSMVQAGIWLILTKYRKTPAILLSLRQTKEL